mmetsp:Transcript_24657/g.62423  ORF Transcript_24657/g.62423 Transcript_24657/m.62423 type:complete len:195 (-) Transcript_24657:675-1259(-)
MPGGEDRFSPVQDGEETPIGHAFALATEGSAYTCHTVGYSKGILSDSGFATPGTSSSIIFAFKEKKARLGGGRADVRLLEWLQELKHGLFFLRFFLPDIVCECLPDVAPSCRTLEWWHARSPAFSKSTLNNWEYGVLRSPSLAKTRGGERGEKLQMEGENTIGSAVTQVEGGERGGEEVPKASIGWMSMSPFEW